MINNFKTLSEVPAWHAQYNSNATAFVFEDRQVSFDQFELHVNQVASGLLSIGILPKARIAMLSKESDWGYEILFGAIKVKAVTIPINPRLSAQEIQYILIDGEVEVLFVGEEYISLLQEITGKLTRLTEIIILKSDHRESNSYVRWRSSYRDNIFKNDYSYDPQDTVVQVYTSGTTGRPKGVQLAHYSFFKLLQGMKEHGDNWMNLHNDDTLLLVAPMFHIGGLWWALQGFIAGARGVVLESFVAWKVLEAIEKYRISRVAMVPAMLQFCLAEPSLGHTDLSSVKSFLYGGSPITPALLRKAMDVFSCDFYQIYGMTETGNMAVCLRPEDHLMQNNKRRNAAGKPLPGVEIKVIDVHGNVLPINTTGEICIKSPSHMVGYWKNEKATSETLVNGWIHTGDGGYIDDEGYVFVSDRMKDMIICAGENIFPAEIESALSDHEAVAEVAVVGVPDELWGEAIKALVVLHPNATVKQRELINFVRTKIADFKIPKSITFVDSLPKNANGKILKRIIRAPFWEGQERLVN